MAAEACLRVRPSWSGGEAADGPAPLKAGKMPCGWRAKCCGCTEAFQASRAGSIPVARLLQSCRMVVRWMPRGVAQSGSAPGWGPGGRRFKSCLPDTRKGLEMGGFWVLWALGGGATGEQLGNKFLMWR
jgi:hypothetical protein